MMRALGDIMSRRRAADSTDAQLTAAIAAELEGFYTKFPEPKFEEYFRRTWHSKMGVLCYVQQVDAHQCCEC